MHWFDSNAEVLEFAHRLVAAGALPGRMELLYYFEKPWKWENQYEIWCKLGKPTEDDSLVWIDFIERIA